MNKEDRNSFRKEIIGKLEEQWAKSNSPEDDLFYYHPSEDKIVLSHALFWVMTQNIKGKVGKEKWFFSNFGTFMYLSLRRPLSAKEKSRLFHP